MKAKNLMKKAPIDWEKIVDKLSQNERQDLRESLENISERAGILAGYLDERHGYGCGDQGHDKAVKTMNRIGKIIHMKAFGYNAYHELKI